MATIFDPILNRLRRKDTGNSGASGELGGWNGAVDYWSNLPDATTYDGEIWYVRNSSGIWGINRKNRGPWKAESGAWNWKPEYEDFFKDSNFILTDETTGNTLKFTLDNLSANREAILPDKSGTVAFISDIGVSAGTWLLEVITLTGTEITNKSLTLSNIPLSDDCVFLQIEGANPQLQTRSWNVSGATISWNGTDIDGILTAGDVMAIKYQY